MNVRTTRGFPRILIAGVVACSLIVPAVAGATGLFAGLSMPMGDMGDAVDTGFHGGARLHFPIVPLTFSAGPQIAYHSLPGAGEDSMSMIELLVTARASLPAGPTVIAGLGFVRKDGTLGGNDLDADTESAWVLGTGSSFAVLEIEALWHHLGDQDMISISAGIGF